MRIQKIESNLGYRNRKIQKQKSQPSYVKAPLYKKTVPINSSFYNANIFFCGSTPVKVENSNSSFENSHQKYTLDKYQKEAINSINEGQTTIVSAPTGTGKTLIAEYAIKDTLDKGKKAIYLSPQKALSSEKYVDFSKLFGNYDKNGNLVDTKNVGLVTGDVTINKEAPILIMTTEVYKNALLAGEKFEDCNLVIYDEFHYIGDKERGSVWEESIMNTPHHIKNLLLSATMPNSKEVENWLYELNPEIKTNLVDVPEKERYVPQRELIVKNGGKGEITFRDIKTSEIDIYRIKNKINFSERQNQAFEELKEILKTENDDEVVDFLSNRGGRNCPVKKAVKKLVNIGVDKEKAQSLALILSNNNSTVYGEELEDFTVKRTTMGELVDKMQEENMLPSLVYIFSKKRCDHAFDLMSENSGSLLTLEEEKMVEEEIEKAKQKGIFLGSDFDEKQIAGLKKGFAVHHAGKLPAYKSLIEKLAKMGLVKVCFATETLVLGINMPFKTAVFTSLEKFDGDEIKDISSSTFKQGAGRAGRRGKDVIGNVVLMPEEKEDVEKYINLSKSKVPPLKSVYEPSYSSILSDVMLNDIDGTLLKSLCANQDYQELERLEILSNNKLEMLEEMGFVEKLEDGSFIKTQKGEIASKIHGVNEIVLGELLYSPDYFKDFTETELTLIASMFADAKNEEAQNELSGEYSYLNDRINSILELNDNIEALEDKHSIYHQNADIDFSISPFIVKFMEAPNNKTEALEAWQDIIKEMQEKEILFQEGDFLRKINRTIDILKLIQELALDKNIKDNAASAIEKLRKPPVLDVLNYELDTINTINPGEISFN